MNAAQLLAIVEVPHDERVRCQANGCNHPVFRRIHVVRDEGNIHVYGSECFKKLFFGLPIASSNPAYTSTEGRSLTDEERRLLIENTERLVQQLKVEYQAEVERKSILAKASTSKAPSPKLRSTDAVITSSARSAAETQAKAAVRAKYGVDPELPGWHGLVILEIKRILGKKVG